MKALYKILAAAASILALSSCVEEAVAPLTGVYEKPVVYEMNTLVSQPVEKGEKTRTFTVEMSGTNSSMTMKFVGDKYYLHDAGYTAAPAAEAKKGNYIVGNGGSTFTLNGNTVNIDSGTMTVVQKEGNYSFHGILWLADESIVEVKSKLALVYEPDPEPVVLSSVLSATSNLANGVSTVTMQLAQDGIYSETDMTTWQTVWYGEGNYLSIDLYSADGFLHEGTYTANTVGGTVGEGEFGIGYDTTVDWGWGPMEMKDWGTCWWTVSGGAATAQKILSGTVTVSKKGSKWVIELVSGEGKEMIWAKFTGEIEALTDSGTQPGGDTTDYEELTTLLSATSNVANGTPSLTINMGTADVSATYNTNTWSWEYSGTGNYLALDIYSADGKLYTGTYNANAVGGTIGEGEFGIGFDTEMWGMQFFNWGTCWWTVEDGVTSAEKILDGTVEVAVEGDNLVIKLKSETVNAKFTYPVASFADAYGTPIEVVNLGGNEPEPEPEPTPDYTKYTQLLLVQPNAEYDENYQPTGNFTSLTLKFGTDGITSESVANQWGGTDTVYKGDGQILSIDFYTTDGTLAEGTYTACETSGTILEGEFGIGYDVEMWGMQMVWGTCVTPYTADVEGEITKVLDGTITVELSGDEYTITLESSTVNAQYIGTLTL